MIWLELLSSNFTPSRPAVTGHTHQSLDASARLVSAVWWLPHTDSADSRQMPFHHQQCTPLAISRGKVTLSLVCLAREKRADIPLTELHQPQANLYEEVWSDPGLPFESLRPTVDTGTSHALSSEVTLVFPPVVKLIVLYCGHPMGLWPLSSYEITSWGVVLGNNLPGLGVQFIDRVLA